MIAFGTSARSTTDANAASLPATVGVAARARAAAWRPVAVSSCASAASISAPSAAPSSTRLSSSSHRRSVSTVSPSSATVPSSRPRSGATWSAVDASCAKNFTSCSCRSEPAAASCARPQSRSPMRARVAARRSGATYDRAARPSWLSVVRTVVDSVSAAMLPSTRSTYADAGVSPSRTASHTEPHTRERASGSAIRDRCSTAAASDASSSRIFAYARSSSLSSTSAGRSRPTSSGTSVRSPSTSMTTWCVRVSAPSTTS